MMKIDFEIADDPKWYTIFCLLSIERSETFLPEIGLKLSNFGPTRECARDFVRQFKRGPLPNQTILDLVQGTFESIARRSDTATAKYLYGWGNTNFHNGDAYQYMVARWYTVFGDLARNNSQLVPLGLSPHKVNQLRIALDPFFGQKAKELRRQINNADNLPLDDWDSYLYENFRLFTDCETCSPLDGLGSRISEYRFPSVWQAIKKILTPDEMQGLLFWANAQGEQFGFTLEMPDL